MAVTMAHWARVGLVLITGSLPAPLIYILLALFQAEGFRDLRGASVITVFYYLVGGWIASAAITTVVGLPLWSPIHRRQLDGVLGYVVIAVIACMALTLIVSSGIPSVVQLAMAFSNALAIRGSERLLLKTANK